MQKALEGVIGERPVTTDMPEKYLKVCEALNFDLIVTRTSPPSFKPRDPTATVEKDRWGRIFKVDNNNDMLWYVDGPVKTKKDYRNLSLGAPDESMIKAAKRLIKLTEGEYAIAGDVGGPFTESWKLMGFNAFTTMMYRDPVFVSRVCADIARWHIELGKLFIEAGTDIIRVGDDLGEVGAPLISPNKFREVISPHLSEMVKTFKRLGVKVLLHSCGYVMDFIRDFVDMGIDALHPIERAAGMNLGMMKDKYGDRLTLVGNVDGKYLVPSGSKEEIEEQVVRCIKIAGPGGGYILATDHSIHLGISGERARFLFRVARKHGAYPIS